MAYIDANDLFKCETCRRYKGDKCLAWCENGECYSPNMKKIPTADIVPKSEVDEIAEELSDTIVMKDELFDEVIKLRGELANAKAKVAREIFKEIETCMKDFEDDDDGYLLKKCEFEFFMREIRDKYTESENG